MTVKELEAAFTAAAENTMQKAEALGLDSASLRAQCEKHGAAACLNRNGAVGDVRLRFIGQYTRFQNPEDDMVIPPPTEGMGGATFGSRMNAPIGSPSTPPPPSASDYMPQTDNPFGGVGLDGPVPF